MKEGFKMSNNNIDFLIKFDNEGNRTETYAYFVHYFSADDDFVKEKLKDGFIFVNTADYNNLLGNNKDNQIYTRNSDGIFIPKPPYIPTAEEEQQAKYAALDAEYKPIIDDFNSQIIIAETVDQDKEYAEELRQQKAEKQAEYIQKRSEL